MKSEQIEEDNTLLKPTRTTSGPWTLDAEGGEDGWDEIEDFSTIFLSGLPWERFARVITKLRYSETLYAEGVANAHLMKAAPELYDALARVLKELEEEKKITKKTMERARKAIASADGPVALYEELDN